MDTAAIKTPVIASGGTTAKASTSDTTSPDASFDSVLSREISDRSNANATNSQQTSNKTADTATAKPVEDAESEDAAVKQAENGADTIPLLVLVAELIAASGGATAQATSSTATAESPTAALSDSSTLTAQPELQSVAQDSEMTMIATQELQSAEQNASGQSAKGTAFSETMNQVSDSKATNTNIANQSAERTPSAPNGTLLAAASTLESPVALKNLGNDALNPVIGEDLTANSAIMAQVQQAAANNTNITGSQTNNLTSQVGTPNWNQSLGQKVVWMLSNEVQSASLTLNPPDLGPLQVVLNVSNNQANASFIATQPEVRQALEAALPKLREMLGNAGIELGQANVSAGTHQQHGSYGEQQSASGFLKGTENSLIPSTITTGSTRVVHQGLVDTFA